MYQKISLEIYSTEISIYLITTLGKVFERGEALNFYIFYLVSSAIHLGNDDILTILEFLTKLVPNGSQLFTMSAPWRICGRRENNKI